MIPYKMFIKGLEKMTLGSLCAQMPEMEVWRRRAEEQGLGRVVTGTWT